MKRTVALTVGLVALMFVASFMPQRTPAQTPKSHAIDTASGYRVERVQIDPDTCVVIVSKGDHFTQGPCD